LLTRQGAREFRYKREPMMMMSGAKYNNASRMQMLVGLVGLAVAVALLSLAGAPGADAFVIVVEPREEQCVYENAKPGYFISVQFHVLEGGHQDVDIKVSLLPPSHIYISLSIPSSVCECGSNAHCTALCCAASVVNAQFTFRSANEAEDAERLVLMAQRRTEEKYTFTAEDHGEYKFCFSNLMSLSSSKTLNVATSVTMPREHVVEGTALARSLSRQDVRLELNSRVRPCRVLRSAGGGREAAGIGC
jgi:hypothetical protein